MADLLTPKEIELATKLRRDGMTWAALARTLGREHMFVRRQLDAEFQQYRSLLSASYVKRQRLMKSRAQGDIGLGSECPKPHHGERPEKLFIPPEVEADKERRSLLEHSTFTAAHCGDPLPGRSALDKRKPKLVVSDRD